MDAAAVMMGLGDRHVRMKIRFGNDSLRPTALQIASANCTRLREVKWVFKGNDMDSMKSLSTLVNTCLPSLHVDVLMSGAFDEEDDHEYVDLVEQNRIAEMDDSEIEMFALELKENFYCAERERILRKLGSACKLLEEVILYFEMCTFDSDMDFPTSIVNVFSTCPNLKLLSVASDRDEVWDIEEQDACNAWADNSNIQFVFLFGTQYLPRLK